MSALRLVCGSCINHGKSDRLGFDAYADNRDHGVFVLCDGANSCPDSGRAAAWLSRSLADDPRVLDDRRGFEVSLRSLHLDMIERFPITACTVLALRIDARGMALASVGDSRLLVLQRGLAGWGAWRRIHEMPRDLNERGHPTQLVGSEVLEQIHQARFAPKGRCLALLMTDGVANSLGDTELVEVVGTLGRNIPSGDDLDYLCRTLTGLALERGCQDDLSAAMIYADFG